MAEIILSKNALDDLKRLHDFLVAMDAEAAKRAGRTIAAHITRLKKYPELVPAIQEKYRILSIPFGKYGYSVAYTYYTDVDTVLILGIKHQKEEFFPFELANLPDSEN
ncbi:MAG: type II toxin-antitoxin system RelE/ParE family toxin [Deltaproteobacteria bacterium]|jgi:plasmid stabilization system protein ParE|nr:type II toxin-antitoxin system RelE/ParE family toxin [Deltaproteobacteria bacterium]